MFYASDISIKEMNEHREQQNFTHTSNVIWCIIFYPSDFLKPNLSLRLTFLKRKNLFMWIHYTNYAYTDISLRNNLYAIHIPHTIFQHTTDTGYTRLLCRTVCAYITAA